MHAHFISHGESDKKDTDLFHNVFIQNAIKLILKLVSITDISA